MSKVKVRAYHWVGVPMIWHARVRLDCAARGENLGGPTDDAAESWIDERETYTKLRKRARLRSNCTTRPPDGGLQIIG